MVEEGFPKKFLVVLEIELRSNDCAPPMGWNFDEYINRQRDGQMYDEDGPFYTPVEALHIEELPEHPQLAQQLADVGENTPAGQLLHTFVGKGEKDGH